MGFGDFNSLCAQTGIPVCSLLGQPTTLTSAHNPLILPQCTARSIEFANTIIFQAASDFAHIAALFMTAIMIFHVKSKFTAVGRKEILTFFYLYMILTAISLVLDAGVIPATNGGPFPWFVAAQNGVISAMCTSLLINGFVGFQLYEDGTTLSVWLLRLTCLGMFVISFAVSLLTFKGWAGLSPTNTTGLFVVVYVINAICIAVYLVMQTILVVNTLQDRWPLGDLAFGVFFFIVGQVIIYVLGTQICEGTSRYLDGLFFGTVCNLLGVMMVYKYWDSITKEDLEFSVGAKTGSWDIKDTLFDPSEEFAPTRHSLYDGQTSRTSLYDSSSMDYRPQSQHGFIPPSHHGHMASRDRLTGHGYAALTEGPQNYGDVRKSVNVHANSLGTYDNYSDRSHSRHRSDRSLPRGMRGVSREREVVYDRY